LLGTKLVDNASTAPETTLLFAPFNHFLPL
jgi:hypothetical protein